MLVLFFRTITIFFPSYLFLLNNYFYREFLFPADLKIDLECWSEERDYTADELHEVREISSSVGQQADDPNNNLSITCCHIDV